MSRKTGPLQAAWFRTQGITGYNPNPHETGEIHERDRPSVVDLEDDVERRAFALLEDARLQWNAAVRKQLRDKVLTGPRDDEALVDWMRRTRSKAYAKKTI